MTPDLLPITNALVALLEAQTGRPVGRGSAPLAGGVVADLEDGPYAIVYQLAGGSTWGPMLYGPDEASQLPYQVTSVGKRGDQADWMADRVRQVMVGRTDGTLTHALVVPGLTILDREFSAYGGQDRDGDVVSVPDTYMLHVTI